ncbi:hypothetical protein WKK05_01045 [Nostoc sp. UHCC 0302]|uniref:hypothetical protein n=1 Tax=Nostoc sp. UHCC 0302 TaxID=3134896 RepID=UPI00311C8CC3
MTLEKERRSVGVFAKRLDAELALQELKAANFSMHHVSVIAQNTEEQADIAGVEVKKHTGNISDEGAAAGAVSGGALGGVTGLLVGLGLLAIPGIGPIMLAGAEATAIATALAGSAIGAAAGSLAGALLGFGIPEEQARVYSDLVSKGYYLVIVTGAEEEIHLAKMILHNRDIQQWGTYELSPSLNKRYKSAVGVFSTRQHLERAFSELRTAGFPMSHVSVVAEETNSLDDLGEVKISSSQYNYANLGIPDDLTRYYEHRVSLGDYLVILNGTDIHIAAARTILESNKIQHFHTYSRAAVNSAKSNYQILSANRYF